MNGPDVPMRVVTRLTGLSADTLRAWERRHGAITPARTEGKARRYSDAEVRRLTLLRAATLAGHTIGAIASLPDDELRALGATRESAGTREAIETYLASLVRFDLVACSATLAALVDRSTPSGLVNDVLVPLMHEVGERWHAGALSVAHEHLATSQVSELTRSLMAAAPLDVGAPRIVLAAPERHLHEIGLLFGALMAAHRGVRPVLLGANLPLAELGPAMRRADASLAVVACVRDLEGDERRTIPSALAEIGARHELWVGVPVGHALTKLEGVRVLTSLAELDTALATRFARAR